MHDLTKLALSALVLLAGLDPAIGELRISPAVDVAPVHGAQRHDAPARPGLSLHGHRGAHHRSAPGSP